MIDVINEFTCKREMEKGIGLTHSFLLLCPALHQALFQGYVTQNQGPAVMELTF